MPQIWWSDLGEFMSMFTSMRILILSIEAYGYKWIDYSMCNSQIHYYRKTEDPGNHLAADKSRKYVMMVIMNLLGNGGNKGIKRKPSLGHSRNKSCLVKCSPSRETKQRSQEEKQCARLPLLDRRDRTRLSLVTQRVKLASPLIPESSSSLLTLYSQSDHTGNRQRYQK